jgi:hypothetical protein
VTVTVPLMAGRLVAVTVGAGIDELLTSTVPIGNQ